jgi:T3SS (YopN, CesT) and YbjN peptide-binding chaperone 1/T3SS (YopN, CesT) and YbjN peptide-binding chaperone 3
MAHTQPPRVPARRAAPAKRTDVRVSNPRLGSGNAPAGAPMSPSWDSFAVALAEVLALLEDENVLLLQRKRTKGVIRITARGAAGLRAETGTECSRLKGSHEGEEASVELCRLGWQIEACDDGEPTPADQANPRAVKVFCEWQNPVPFPETAALVVRTLREVFGATRPDQLLYGASDPGNLELLLPSLRINRSRGARTSNETASRAFCPRSRSELLKVVVGVVQRSTGIPSLVPDSDGDVSLTYGSATVFVRVDPNAPLVSLFSPVLANTDSSFALLEALNELNHSFQLVKFSHLGTTVFAVAEIRATPFISDHLEKTLEFFGKLCDEKVGELHSRFGERGTPRGQKAHPAKTPTESVN